MTQKQRVKEYLLYHEEITPMEAFSELGITKLATVISSMIREDGEPIQKTWKRSTNRYGEPVLYMSYHLAEGETKVAA